MKFGKEPIPDRARKCTKKTYRDKGQAIAAIHLIQSKGSDDNRGYKPIRYYKCIFCKKYHITHQTYEQFSRYGESEDE